jgi:hypothetical protein
MPIQSTANVREEWSVTWPDSLVAFRQYKIVCRKNRQLYQKISVSNVKRRAASKRVCKFCHWSEWKPGHCYELHELTWWSCLYQLRQTSIRSPPPPLFVCVEYLYSESLEYKIDVNILYTVIIVRFVMFVFWALTPCVLGGTHQR